MKYLVVCFGANDYIICHDKETLAQQLARHWIANLRRGDDPWPVTVYELGPEVKVTLKQFEVEKIERMEEAKPCTT